MVDPAGASRDRHPRHQATGTDAKAQSSAADSDSGSEIATAPGLRQEDEEEEEERAIAAAALYAETSRAPSETIRLGPGMVAGPLRFLPPQKRIHLYWEYVGWCEKEAAEAASFQTFLRAFAASRDKLRIRKAGAHATCDQCLALKKAIRSATFPQARQHAVERYTEHILLQWLDRQVYWHAQTLSSSLRAALVSGQTFRNLARSMSQACLIVDGIDQAKFRIPRILQKGHSLDKLLRPALHVQGAWCHGFGYHLAVSDADMKKDTNNNVEVIARMLSELCTAHGGLPASLHLQQDNTSRECKNQHMMCFAAKVVALGVLESITLAYLITGHTHENLDGTFGQLTVKLSAREFSDDREVLSILQQLLLELGIDPASRASAKAYKLDEAADWEAWWGELGLTLSALTGPEAPHWFRICRLRDLGRAAGETDVPLMSPPGMPEPCQDDVVMAVKDRMASSQVDQVVRLVPAAACRGLTLVQPQGQHSRRPGGCEVKAKVARVARELRTKGVLSDSAAEYLVGWAEGTRPREARPATYQFLQERRWRVPEPAAKAAAAKVLARMPRERQPARPVRVCIRGRGGAALDARPDEDEADPGPLVEGGAC